MKKACQAGRMKWLVFALALILLPVCVILSPAHIGGIFVMQSLAEPVITPAGTNIYYGESPGFSGSDISRGLYRSTDGDFGAVFLGGAPIEKNGTMSDTNYKIEYTCLSGGNRAAAREAYTVLNGKNYTVPDILSGFMMTCTAKYKEDYQAGLASSKNITIAAETGTDIPGMDIVYQCNAADQNYFSHVRCCCITNGPSGFTIYYFICNLPAGLDSAAQAYFDTCFFADAGAKKDEARNSSAGIQTPTVKNSITADSLCTYSYYDIGSTYLVDSGGFLWVWGGNQFGQLGVGTMSDVPAPKMIMGDVSRVVPGYGYAYAIKKDGSLWGWGNNDNGQMYDETKTVSLLPKKLMDGVKDACAANTNNYIIKSDGSLWGWNRYSMKLIKALDGPIKKMHATSDYMMVLKEDGSLFTQGFSIYGMMGNGSPYEGNDKPVKVLGGVKDFSVSFNFVLAVKNDGSLWGWGNNSEGQLGGISTKEYNSPAKLMDGAAEAYAGEGYTIVLKEDGSVWSWGTNEACQLGNGTRTDSLIPVKVLDGVKHIFGGYWHTFALKEDGSLWGWGDAAYAQLGNGQYEAVPAPIQILDHVETVTAGKGYTFAIKTDGSLWAFGSNYHGTLGIGSGLDGLTPEALFIPQQ